MSRPRSLRRDLQLGLSAGLVALWLLAILAAAVVVREEMDEVFDSALQETAERLLPLAVAGGAAVPRRLARAGEHGETLTWVVRDAQGRPVLWSPEARAATFAEPGPLGFRTTASHRIHAATDRAGRWRIEVAEPLANRREAVRETLVALAAPLLLLLPFTLALVAWRTRAGLARLQDLSHEVQGRDATDLRPLATAGLQAELLPIRAAVDRLMARLGRALEGERSFTAHAAHELRTPIAAALAQSQRLLAEAPEALRPRVAGVEAELKRLARLSEKLLHLARAEGAGVVAAEAQDLAPILRMVLADFGPEPRLSAEVGPLAARLDPDAFAILARNLIENALLHGTGPVGVALGAGGLRVTSGGEVVPPELLARLARRFQRGRARATGSGLGLAIARGIAEGAGWQLCLASPAPGRADGFEARAIPPQESST